jgi:hypothetical protein
MMWECSGMRNEVFQEWGERRERLLGFLASFGEEGF